MSTLQDVEAAKAQLAAAERHYRQTIANAIEGGVPLSKVARVANVSRQTIYNWIESLSEAK